MTTAVQHRRGTTAEHATFTGLEGEVTIDTTKDTAVIHDGVLAGGYPLAKETLANVNPSTLGALTGSATASDDLFLVFDTSTLTMKKITRAELNNAMEADALASVTITGGTINGTTIGATTAAAGSFTTLTTSSTVTHNGGTANGVTYLNGSKVLTSGSALTFDGTNLGIGTSSPAFPLDVAGAIRGNSWIGRANTSAPTADAFIFRPADNTLGLGTGNTERMRINSSGNVGIGTSTFVSPDRLVAVGNSADSRMAMRTQNTSGQATVEAQVNNYWSGATYTGTGIVQYDSAATGTTAGLSNANLGALRFQNGSAGLIYTNGGSPLVFANYNTERMRIDSSGNVGIGTSSPSAKLAVVGTSGSPQFGAGTSGNGLFINAFDSNPIYMTASATNSTAFGFGAASNIPLFFMTNNTERARIDSSGNVGIGTSSPSEKLDVYGTNPAIQIKADSTSGTSTLFFSDAGGASGRIRYYHADDALALFTSGLERLRLDSSGNVGIGTSSPSEKLAVYAASGYVASSLYSGANNIRLYANGTDIGIQSVTSGNPIIFQTNGGSGSTERMRLDSSGNVGIGTSSPVTTSARLSVKASGDYDAGLAVGSNASANNWARLDFKNTNAAQPTILYQDQAGTFTIRTDGAYPITFNTNGANERMRIDSSGNLLVQTNNAYLRLKTSVTNFDISAQAGANDFLRITANGTQRFQFNDIGQAYNSTGTWGTISDVRLKENIADATPKLDGLMQLRVVNYNLKADPDLKQLGFIAQEVEQVFPGLVEDTSDDGDGGHYKAVKTTVLIPMLVKAIQEQQAIIDSLKARLDAANL